MWRKKCRNVYPTPPHKIAVALDLEEKVELRNLKHYLILCYITLSHLFKKKKLQ